jgi:short-subunit dehydrogenase
MVDRGRYGPWAVIAGGSEGMGPEYARQLAADGFSLVLLARKPEPLDAAAELARSAAAADVEVRTLSVDLTTPAAVDAIRQVTDDIEIGLLVYNAGANSYGLPFLDGELDRFRPVIDLNVGGKLALCHHFGGLMRQRGRGGILIVGSLSGYTGSPHTSIYNASKAFSRVFAESLWYELRPHGVHVVEFVVGGVKTPAMARRGMHFGPGVSDPHDVAREGLEHLADGPVWTSALAGGVATAEAMTSFPREPVIEAMAENLRKTGLYD